MINIWVVLSSLLALVLYVPLCIQILSGKVKQNFASWILWTSIDVVVVGTIVAQHGNYLLPVTYTFGTLATTLCILRSGTKSKWTWFEGLVVLLVLICLVIWISSGAKVATIASTLAMAIAGIPQVLDSYRRPWETPILVYFGYFIANTLSVVGGRDWSVEERFYPMSAALFCLLFVILGSRKFWSKQSGPIVQMVSHSVI